MSVALASIFRMDSISNTYEPFLHSFRKRCKRCEKGFASEKRCIHRIRFAKGLVTGIPHSSETVGLCLGPYGDPMEGINSYGRGTPVVIKKRFSITLANSPRRGCTRHRGPTVNHSGAKLYKCLRYRGTSLMRNSEPLGP